MPSVRAPFDPEQVAALNLFQRYSGMHPFTCGRRGDPHYDDVLFAEQAGWRCPDRRCDYTQDWAHDFMADLDTVQQMMKEHPLGGITIANIPPRWRFIARRRWLRWASGRP